VIWLEHEWLIFYLSDFTFFLGLGRAAPNKLLE